MNMQRPIRPDLRARAVTQRLTAGQAVAISPWPGELMVVDGRIWLTRRGDVTDHVLEAGHRLRLHAADAAVIETWSADGAAVRWQPLHQGRLRAPFLAVAVAGLGLFSALAGGLARALAGAARRMEAWARSAAPSARRAQGSISADESMACGGTVQ